MTEDDHLFDLLVQERKGQLNTAEQQRLEAATAASPALQLAERVHRSFEELGAFEPRDDERCEDIARAVRARLGWSAESRSPRPTPRRGQAVVLALVFAAGAAAASVTTWKLTTHGDGSALISPSSSSVPPPPLRAPVADVPADVPAASPVAPFTDAAAEAAAPAAAPTVKKLSDERLFEQATALKAAGKWPAAQTLYDRLLREYPGSRYAASCVMTLGKRALAEEKAGRALSLFRHYQALRGPLMAEAMWGEAEALGRLGREQEQAKVMSVLNKRFPLSPYASEKSAP